MPTLQERLRKPMRMPETVSPRVNAALCVYDDERQEAAAALDAKDAEIAKLSNPVAVHVNMLRGTIAKPSPRNVARIYGVVALLAGMDHTRARLAAAEKALREIEAASSRGNGPLARDADANTLREIGKRAEHYFGAYDALVKETPSDG